MSPEELRLLDEFAMHAAQGLLAASTINSSQENRTIAFLTKRPLPESIAAQSYAVAAAMLRERGEYINGTKSLEPETAE